MIEQPPHDNFPRAKQGAPQCIIALDTTKALIAQYAAGSTLHLTLDDAHGVDTLRELPNVTAVTFDGLHLTVTGTGDFAPAVLQVVRNPKHMELKTATLEDVFLNLTGRPLEQEN